MNNVYENPENRLEILRIGFENQVQYLRMMSDVDLKIFSGYITIQLILATWLTKYPVTTGMFKGGILLIDFAFTLLAINAFHVNQKRRREAVRVLTNLSAALGFTVEGAFLPGKAIQTLDSPESDLPIRPWTRLYYTTVIVSTLGVAIIVLSL